MAATLGLWALGVGPALDRREAAGAGLVVGAIAVLSGSGWGKKTGA